MKAGISSIDEYFLFALIFLAAMVLYSLPLGTIYTTMTIIGLIMYYVSVDQNLFRQIPFNKDKGHLLQKTMIGTAFAVGFILAYSSLSKNLSNVFAATAFGSSELLGKIVYGLLIPPVETVFFFVILPGWLIYKIGWSMTLNPFSFDGMKIIVTFALLFTAFHFTAKGIKNTPDLITVFAFGALSMAMIMYFKEAIQAVIMHIVNNSYSVGLFDSLKEYFMQPGLFTSGIWMYVAIGVGIYLVARWKFNFRIGIARL